MVLERRLSSHLAALVTLVGLCELVEPSSMRAQSQPIATFKSGVSLVSVSAVVRDRKGRFVANLVKQDFQVLEEGRPRPILDFREDETAPISMVVLFDVSGSMQAGGNMAEAKHAADHVLSWLQPNRDEAALYTFDTKLRQLQDFSKDPSTLHGALDKVRPFGATSLYDAIAEAARSLAGRARVRRGLVVITDGLDTASRLSPEEVSGIASAIDVPVYVVAVSSPIDHPGAATGVPGRTSAILSGPIDDLARWTGGQAFTVSAPAHASTAAREIINELRHQYLLAFEPAGKPGWHSLEVRTRDKNLKVRARSGYVAGDVAQ